MATSSLNEESNTFLSKINFLNQFSDDKMSSFNLVLPGEKITSESGFIQGKGTYEEKGVIYSSIIGYVNQTDKLVSVIPLKSRYTCKVGDVVIGRVSEIHNKKWKIDINSSDSAGLHLNAVNLAEVQRRKTEEDEKQMRQFLREGDLVCAEVQSVNQDGTINLHIRSNKFGKLANGVLVEIEHSLVKQHSKHIVDLTFGVKIILAMNGKVWLEPNQISENSIDQIARLKNIVQVLAQNFVCISITNLTELYNQTTSIPVQGMNMASTRELILSHVAKLINTGNIENIADLIKRQGGADEMINQGSYGQRYGEGNRMDEEDVGGEYYD